MASLPLLRGTLIELFPWRDVPGRPGVQSRDAQLAVWCPICATYHYHGWNPADTGRVKTHRVAHCASGPFDEHGYYVSVWRKSDPEYVGHVAKPGTVYERPKP